MQTILAERFEKGVRAIFADAEVREKGLGISVKLGFAGLGAGQNVEGLSTTEIWGGFLAWVACMKEIGLFNSAVHGNDTGVAALHTDEQNGARGNTQGQQGGGNTSQASGMQGGGMQGGGMQGAGMRGGGMQGGVFMPPQFPAQMPPQIAEAFFKAWFQQNAMMGLPSSDREMSNRTPASPVESEGTVNAGGARESNDEFKKDLMV